MKTIILGYADAGGFGASTVVCGPDVSVEDQQAVIDAANDLHKFPEGVKCLRQFELDENAPLAEAAFISDDVAAFQQQSDAKKQKQLATEREQAKADVEVADLRRLANRTFTEYANRRNVAIAAVAAQTNILQSEGFIDPKERAAVSAKVEKLQPAADAAVALFTVVMQARNVVLNPKSTPEQVAAAVETLKKPTVPTTPPTQ